MAVNFKSSDNLINEHIKTSMSENHSKILNLADKVSSGKVAKRYSDYVGTTSIEGLLSSKDIENTLQSKIVNNTTLNYKLNEIDRVHRSLINVLSDSLILCQRAGDPSVNQDLDIAGLARNQLEQIKLLLDSSFEGQKLFAGGKTDVATTIGDIANITNIVDGVITANYYEGDDYVQSSLIAKNRNLEYGINASNQAFQNFIAAHNYLISGDNDSARTLLWQSEKDIGSLLIDNGTNSLVVEEQIELDKNTVTALQEQISNIEDTDILESMTDMAKLEVQLKASFMLTNRIADLSLVNFLR